MSEQKTEIPTTEPNLYDGQVYQEGPSIPIEVESAVSVPESVEVRNHAASVEASKIGAAALSKTEVPAPGSRAAINAAGEKAMAVHGLPTGK